MVAATYGFVSAFGQNIALIPTLTTGMKWFPRNKVNLSSNILYLFLCRGLPWAVLLVASVEELLSSTLSRWPLVLVLLGGHLICWHVVSSKINHTYSYLTDSHNPDGDSEPKQREPRGEWTSQGLLHRP